MSSAETDFAALVSAKIANLRPKLLDLSRRNPLIATKLGPRSNAHIRAVDELPDVLFFQLTNGQELELLALPPIDEDPKDEQAEDFRNAVINARLIDEAYSAAMEAVDRDSDSYSDETRKVERALKDRVREQLGLAPRAQKTEVNLAQHARNNHITPSYELPTASERYEDGRHEDGNIQTLLLPSDLERKLNSISSKSRTWIQETGMNVLQIAFGFLEWSEADGSESSFAPLILLQVELRKTRTPRGPRFSLLSSGEEPELNDVLAEKLRIDFAIDIPRFENASSVEEFFIELQDALQNRKGWRIRRQIAVGVFPSARMAMYHDIDPSQYDFSKSKIVRSLLAGDENTGATPFADEYNVDEPHIEKKVPHLVLDADSSQFSALVDIADGKNVSLEGPPGTGKSQTIVNAIASAIAHGKKVLFVAEKLAALNVVKSRLEAAGLGEFLLALQAEKSTREQVVASIKERLEIRNTRAPRGLELKIAEFREVRDQISEYIDLMTQQFAHSGFSIHEILGLKISTTDALDDLTSSEIDSCKMRQEMLTKAGLEQLLKLCEQIEKAHLGVLDAQPHWRETRLTHPNTFVIEDACDLAKRASSAALALEGARSQLTKCKLDEHLTTDTLTKFADYLKDCAPLIETHSKAFLLDVLDPENAMYLDLFLDKCVATQEEARVLERSLASDLGQETLRSLDEIERLCAEADLKSTDVNALKDQLGSERKAAKSGRAIASALAPLTNVRDAAKDWLLDDIAISQSICAEAGRDTLLLRPSITPTEADVLRLKNLCEEGLKLQAESAELATHAVMALDIPVDDLARCASTLRTAGALSLIFGSARKSKVMAMSISRATKFVKEEATKLLDDIVEFKRRATQFTEQAATSRLFGGDYRGIDTKFSSYVRLADFQQKVLDAFGDREDSSLQDFLLSAPLKQLNLLPAIPKTGAGLSFSKLDERISAADYEAARLEELLRRIQSHMHVLQNSNESVENVKILRLRLDGFLQSEMQLNGDSKSAAILADRFSGFRTEASQFSAILSWSSQVRGVHSHIRNILTSTDATHAIDLISAVLATEEEYERLLDNLKEAAQIDVEEFTSGLSLSEAAASLLAASSDPDGLAAFAEFASVLLDAEPEGLMSLVRAKMNAGSMVGLSDQVEAIAIRTLAKAVYTKHSKKLSKYRGSRLDELRASLATLDKELIELARQQLRAKTASNASPPRGNGIGKKSTWTQMALLEHEVSKTQRFISVRDLTQRAGEALTEIKPCWMMSPLAVAQYVPKGSIHFDLCIIDEASQMPPESALGALLRSAQTVVVGDTNQLPPSNFFKAVIDEEDEDEDEIVLEESVLEMANASFRPARRLRWHYRSRHSGLIKFSNRLVYDDNLVVFPSATESLSRMGVEYRNVRGLYKAGTNPIEAKAVVDAVISFMKSDPDRSLGVVTLNQKQRDLIKEEFEYALASNRSVQKYVDAWRDKNDGLEEFFVKNLENVQGDERDVIFIGTVYGPQEVGARVMQRFGPINGLAGKRRLNVLFTRAKQKIVTFSSMTAADIEADEAGNPGVFMLKRWLEYSATGVLDSGAETEREPDSEFEVFVIDQLRSMGLTAVPQVGVAGYFVDIGVRHPDWPHGFVLGVECDGATYHSAKSARDRDRLRQEVLEGLGWKLHRIWSTDWFNNSSREADRLRLAVTERLKELKAREHEYADRAQSAPSPGPIAEAAAVPARDLFDYSSETAPAFAKVIPAPRVEGQVEIGDTVRVRFLEGDKSTLIVTISPNKSAPNEGLIFCKSPMATSLIGAEVGDEVSVLAGSYLKKAVIESVTKPDADAA